MGARPYTPDTLAERWGCSANTVRNMIKRGELRAFRSGRRLIRIPADVVEEIERCQTTGSDGSMAGTSSPGGRTEPADRAANREGDVISPAGCPPAIPQPITPSP